MKSSNNPQKSLDNISWLLWDRGWGRQDFVLSGIFRKGSPLRQKESTWFLEDTSTGTYRGTSTGQRNGTTGISWNLTMICIQLLHRWWKKTLHWHRVGVNSADRDVSTLVDAKLGINQQCILTAKLVLFSWVSRSTMSSWRRVILFLSSLLVWLHLLSTWEKKENQ